MTGNLVCDVLRRNFRRSRAAAIVKANVFLNTTGATPSQTAPGRDPRPARDCDIQTAALLTKQSFDRRQQSCQLVTSASDGRRGCYVTMHVLSFRRAEPSSQTTASAGRDRSCFIAGPALERAGRTLPQAGRPLLMRSASVAPSLQCRAPGRSRTLYNSYTDWRSDGVFPAVSRGFEAAGSGFSGRHWGAEGLAACALQPTARRSRAPSPTPTQSDRPISENTRLC